MITSAAGDRQRFLVKEPPRHCDSRAVRARPDAPEQHPRWRRGRRVGQERGDATRSRSTSGGASTGGGRVLVLEHVVGGAGGKLSSQLSQPP